jgi:hypothetical protein
MVKFISRYLWVAVALAGVVSGTPGSGEDNARYLKVIDEGTADLLLVDKKYGIRMYVIGENDVSHKKIDSLYFSIITQSLNLIQTVPEHYKRLKVMRVILSDHRNPTAHISRGVMRVGAHNYMSRHLDPYYWAGTIAHEITHEEQRLGFNNVMKLPFDLLEYHASLYELDILKRTGAPEGLLQRRSNHLKNFETSKTLFDEKKSIKELIEDCEKYLSENFGFNR